MIIHFTLLKGAIHSANSMAQLALVIS